MQSTFKAAVLKKFNDIEIQEFNVPTKDDLKSNHVLVKMECAGICGAQIGEITGAKGPDDFLPHFLGHEGVGTVIAVGSNVKQVTVKKRVVLHWRKGLGGESAGVRLKNASGTVVGGGPVTTWGEYVIVSENRVTPIGDNFPSEIGALFGCAYSTGYGIVEYESNLNPSKTLLIVGCGGVGLCVALAARIKGVNEICVHEISRKQRILASSFGALVSDSTAVFDNVTFDAVVECTGRPELIEWALKRTAPGGRLVLVGQPKINETVEFKNFRQHYVGKTILDSQGGKSIPYLNIPAFEVQYRAGMLHDLEKIIGDICTLDELPSKIHDILNGKQKRAGRCLIKF